MIIGYTAGVYDLFHVGHLNLFKNAKGMCDKLVVGVTVDELVQYKGKNAMIPFEDRIELVRSCKFVDAAVPQYDMDKLTACKKLVKPVSMDYLYERYRLPENKIDYLKFIDDVFAHESSGSYCNAFITAGMKYTPFFDPSAMVKMGEPLDLNRVRNGESKYLIRELFRKCYPELELPEKIPMPRPVDIYFKNWNGPTRPEFKKDINMSKFTGNQKWQIWCLERFLNLIENK